MKWYIHPSKYLHGDELPSELVMTNDDGSITQVYVRYSENQANDVLQAIDRLRRELSGYHGQLNAHNDLQRHCDNQRERISELEGLYAKAKADRDGAAMDFCREHDRAEFLARRSTELRKQGERLFEKTLKLATEKDRLKDENAKLRRLCKPLLEYTSQDRCEGCACKSRCNDGQVDECWMLAEIREIASELGLEVD